MPDKNAKNQFGRCLRVVPMNRLNRLDRSVQRCKEIESDADAGGGFAPVRAEVS